MSIKYSNGEITINWQSKLCQHAALCVNTLPKIYNPDGSPWITIEYATTEEVKNQMTTVPQEHYLFIKTRMMNRGQVLSMKLKALSNKMDHTFASYTI